MSFVDCSSLNAALEAQRKTTSRTMEKCVTSAAAAVLEQAYELTPVVDKAAIVGELGVIVTYRKNKKTGEDLSHKYSKNVARRQGAALGTEVAIPLAQLILLAQMNHAGLHRKEGTGTVSNYNVSTGRRWERPYVRPGGPSLEALETQMIGARFKSGGFIRLGFAAARKMLRRLAYGGGPPVEGEAIAKETLGRAWKESSPSSVSVSLENLVGMASGARGGNAANYNRAMLEKAGPALRQAVNEVALEKMQHVFEAEMRLAELEFAAFR